MSSVEKAIDALIPPVEEFETREGAMGSAEQARQQKIGEAKEKMDALSQDVGDGLKILLEHAMTKDWRELGQEFFDMKDKVGQIPTDSNKQLFELLGISPNSIHQAFLFTVDLQAEGKFREASHVLRLLTTLAPSHPNLWQQQAAALTGLQDYDEAISCLELALALKPEFPEALLTYALCEFFKEKTDIAHQKMSEALAILHDKADEMHQLEPLINATKKAIQY